MLRMGSGVLSMFGDEAKEFEVLQLAPSGTDFVVQQEVKLKTFTMKSCWEHWAVHRSRERCLWGLRA